MRETSTLKGPSIDLVHMKNESIIAGHYIFVCLFGRGWLVLTDWKGHVY